ncbi:MULTISPECIES: tetratricopeptide repeat-containing hybrid sensor histidine kinase/response regulator [Salegentibacter]|uniref:histidine kinase n=1 Tax=Salegentibacter maritimus TaxID=2794347 RepID=A0ABS0TJ26_9FLAO|nr:MULTISPECIES: ATP-binding protein [Salegentibacter]MBE7640420.1 response regulator [Salegentibacter sp. BLCTC]MBI6115760.1 response regulator [Salegentibacter maritimus]MBI6119988.1 response regulator [Salegentibacter maritimus]
MKRFNFILIFVFYCNFSFAIQQDDSKHLQLANERIQQLINDAEVSVNTLDFDRAIEQLNSSLELSKSIDDKRFIALSSSILAKLYYIRHEYDKAITELNRAISIQREVGDEKGLAYSYVNFAKIFMAKHNKTRANRYLNLAEELYLKLDNQEYLGIVSLNRAIIIQKSEKQINEALKLLEKAKIQLSESENMYELSRLYYYTGRAHIALKNYELAEENCNKALAIAKANNFGGMIMSIYKQLSIIYEETGNYKTSLDYLQKSYARNDSIIAMNKEVLAEQANAKYGIDALQSSLNELSLQNAEQESKLKVNKLTTILSVALITILSLLTLSLYKNNNLRARANELLQKKNTELTKAKENAEKASLAKAQFLSTITHELRTPLYAVTGLTHLLLEESPTENQKEHLNSLKFSGEYLLSLINNILDLNKLEANKVEVMEASFDLKKRISDVLVALQNSADQKNTKIHLNYDNSIPEEIKGDPLKISQILINLIGNSIKFTEDGDIWINVSKNSHEGNIILLDFEIKDNGEGISKEKQKAIFENFTQGSTQINRKFGGTGLGLSIVKNLLSLLGSEIELESDLGKGSTFTFQLKFEAKEIENNTNKTSQDAEAPVEDRLEGKNILIVEDNKINQMITRKILEKHQVICEVADNGTIAVEKTKENEYDLILMDIHMPGISGIEATKEIRKFNTEIPIIALTAVTLDDNLDEFYLNGFSDIIPKPYKTEEFFLKINKQLALKQSTV